jgi:phosphohistidine phosphatase SixA
MRLYLMRHAQPLTLDDTSLLSPGGERQADQLAAMLSQFSLPPGRIAILTTKPSRLRQTAERICQGLGLERDRVVGLPDMALPPEDNFIRQFLVHHIRKQAAEGRDVVLLVGHAPDFPLLFDWFLGPGHQAPSPAHGSIACLEGSAETSGDWVRRWMVAPLPMTFEPAGAASG